MSSNTIILVTGANTGLGFEIVKSLSQSPNAYTILLAGRDIEKANAAAEEAQLESSASVIKTLQIDLEDDDSIMRAFEHVSVEYGRVDVLINNAGKSFLWNLAWQWNDRGWLGGSFDNTAGMALREKWNKSWNTNVSGTYILTHTFVPLLLKSSSPRLLFITSGGSTLAECGNSPILIDAPPPAGWPKQAFAVPGYRASKAGLNMVMREFQRILKNDGVKIWGVSPGFLATGLGGNKEVLKKMGGADPKIGGDFVRTVVEGERDGDVGLVIRKDNVQPF